MSYGCDQTKINSSRRWSFIFFIVMVIALAVAAFLILRNRQLKNAPEAEAFDHAVEDMVAQSIPATNTPVPSQTMTNWPTFTPSPTTEKTGTPVPATKEATQTPTAKPGATPVFLYGVDEVMYLESSINLSRYWNPAMPEADVPLHEKVAIEEVVWNQHQQRDEILLTKEIKDLDQYNAGSGKDQIEQYYLSYLSIPAECKWDISVVNQQFNTVIIYYDGEYARTMTMKVEDRDYLCNDEVRAEVNADGYAYENELQKINGEWKIIEHPAGLGN